MRKIKRGGVMKKLSFFILFIFLTVNAYCEPEFEIISPKKEGGSPFFIEVQTGDKMPFKRIKARIFDLQKKDVLNLELLQEKSNLWKSAQKVYLKEGNYSLYLRGARSWFRNYTKNIDFEVKGEKLEELGESIKDIAEKISLVQAALAEQKQKDSSLREKIGTITVAFIFSALMLFLFFIISAFKIILKIFQRKNKKSSHIFLSKLDIFSKDFESLKEATKSFYSYSESQKEKTKLLIEGLIGFYEQLDALKENPERFAAKEEIRSIFNKVGVWRWAPKEGEVASTDCQKVIAKENKNNLKNNRVAGVIRYGWKMKQGNGELIIKEPVVEVINEEVKA